MESASWPRANQLTCAFGRQLTRFADGAEFASNVQTHGGNGSQIWHCFSHAPPKMELGAEYLH